MASRQPKLGDRAVWRVTEKQRAKTLRGGKTLEGSVHHQEMQAFAGFVCREREKSVDIAIFAPGRGWLVIENAPEGNGPGTFTNLDAR